MLDNNNSNKVLLCRFDFCSLISVCFKGRRPSLRNEQRPVKAISPDTQVGEEKESQVVEPPENRESAFEVQTSENWEQEVTGLVLSNDQSKN